MVEIKNLSFGYNLDERIINDLNYYFKRNNSYIIYGENGCGETTLIKIILGLIKPDEGEIIKEKGISISYLPDYNGLYQKMTMKNNIRFRLGLYKIRFENVKEEYERLIRYFNIKKYEYILVEDLSLGTQKKVAIVAALLVNADLLILDEPTGGLDLESKDKLIHLLNGQNNKCIISVSHDDDYIKGVSKEDNILYME